MFSLMNSSLLLSPVDNVEMDPPIDMVHACLVFKKVMFIVEDKGDVCL